jgi:hypothetical protein
MKRKVLFVSLMAVSLLSAAATFAADLQVPAHATAHTQITIGTQGVGNTTLYLIGPIARMKRAVRLGDNVQFTANEMRAAGLYTVILDGEGAGISRTFIVSPGEPRKLSFLAQPSRVPADAKDVISGTVFLRDADDNLVLAPVTVTFDLAMTGAGDVVRTVETRDGVAWSRIDSSRRAGNAQFTASAGGARVSRVVQLVAGEPCDLRFHVQPGNGGLLAQTEPVRDCAGNAVPDGTMVSFTEQDLRGTSTVDAAVKRGVAQAFLPGAPQATLTVAAGVVSGNEIRWKERAR